MSGICKPLLTGCKSDGPNHEIDIFFRETEVWQFEQDKEREDRIKAMRDNVIISMTVADFSRAFEILSHE